MNRGACVHKRKEVDELTKRNEKHHQMPFFSKLCSQQQLPPHERRRRQTRTLPVPFYPLPPCRRSHHLHEPKVRVQRSGPGVGRRHRRVQRRGRPPRARYLCGGAEQGAGDAAAARRGVDRDVEDCAPGLVRRGHARGVASAGAAGWPEVEGSEDDGGRRGGKGRGGRRRRRELPWWAPLPSGGR